MGDPDQHHELHRREQNDRGHDKRQRDVVCLFAGCTDREAMRDRGGQAEHREELERRLRRRLKQGKDPLLASRTRVREGRFLLRRVDRGNPTPSTALNMRTDRDDLREFAG